MATYLVHSRHATIGEPEQSLRVTFIRDGFSFAAFAITPVWLIARRLWLAALIWIMAVAALVAATNFGMITWAIGLLAYAIVAVLFAMESGALRSAKEGRRRTLRDVVRGRSADEAMRYYFTARVGPSRGEQAHILEDAGT